MSASLAAILAACAGLLVGVGGCISGIIWIAKKTTTAIIQQNQALTDAIRANTSATESLAHALEQFIVVKDERDRTMFKQLDRIESGIRHRRDTP